MNLNLDCIPCFMQQALKATRIATSDEKLQEEALRKTASCLANLPYESTPMEMAHTIYQIIRTVTGNPDPYKKKIKERDNQSALEMYPWLKELLNKSEDRLYAAIKLAAAGNIIDYGVNQEFHLKDTIKSALTWDFAINDYQKFKEDIRHARNIIYLADNAGEIVFDRVLIEEFSEKKITLVVKGGPIINDATLQDVKAVGLDSLVDIDYLGNGEPGTGPERTDPAFLDKLRKADLVISKGQGNFEGLSGEKYIYFLFMTKCLLVAKDIGVKKGDIVFTKGS